MTVQKETWRHTLILSFQSVGVVFGRLSTAPLYVFGTISPEDFKTSDNVYEYFSLIFWALTTISLLKYVFIVLDADNDGEGGTFALYSLLCRYSKVGLIPSDRSVGADKIMNHDEGTSPSIKVESRARRAIEKNRSIHYLMLFLALSGASMIMGDGVLTPAISVLSASTDVQRSLSDIKYSHSPKKQQSISDALENHVPVPLACAILVCLFMLQHFGTHKIGVMFAPVVILWLLFIGGVGLYNICYSDPQIIHAISPWYIFRFMTKKSKSWKSLGSVLLSVAGSEAMFADLGHFSKKSIKFTFICFIYPLLVLCYAGQAAFISNNFNGYEDFNHLRRSVPGHLRHVFVLLSLLASAVGSQATITASFSIINQCVALSCFPRVKVVHTSDKQRGRVYIPDINWLLMFLSITATLAFYNIQKIANAAGLAIIMGMVVTTFFMSFVIALCWEKSIFVSGSFMFFFSTIELIYLSACLLTFHKGAWYLVVLLALAMTCMLAWHYGTMKKYGFDLENKVSTEFLTDLSPGFGISRLPGIGLVYTDIVTGVPAFFSHFITNLPAFHQVLVFVSLKSLPVPYVSLSERYLVGRVGFADYRIYRCIVRHGYCDGIRDANDFEDQIISSIGEFILQQKTDAESLISTYGKRMVVVKPSLVNNDEIQESSEIKFVERASTVRRKKVRFALPESCPNKMPESVKEELQDLINARESGCAYFVGKSHLTVRVGSNFLKRLLIAIYVFLDKNCREPPVALNIPHAALVEVGIVYTI